MSELIRRSQTALRALVALLLVAGVSACSPLRAVESIGFLRGLSTIASNPNSDPRVRRVSYGFTVDGRTYDADLYMHEGPAKAALVLVPGVVREGKDDRRLIAFAQALSQAKFLVLVPEIENLRDLRISTDDVTAIGDAVVHLSRNVDQASVGLVAISYAAGPALIASVQERTRSLLRFVVAVGGYYDIETTVTFFTTGHFRESPDRRWRRVEPNPYSKWVFLKSNVDRVADRVDRALLWEMAELKLQDPQADISVLASQLRADGRSVYALFTNSDPDRVPDLIAALPEKIQADMRRLSPRESELSELEATLFLVHGRDDQIIPFTESIALDAAAPDRQAELYVVASLAHVDLAPLSVMDFLALWRAAYRMLSVRDSMPTPQCAEIALLCV